MSKELDAARELVKMLEEKEKLNKVQLGTLPIGAIFKIGEWDFIVLKHENGTTKVISSNFIFKNVKFDDNSRNYGESNLKKRIEKDIEPIIVKEIGKDNIIEHKAELVSVDMQKEFDDVCCRVRPLTFDEAREFNAFIANQYLSDWWWTLTPWSTSEIGYNYSIAVVSPLGLIGNLSCDCDYGVRPVCILKSNIFVSKVEE